MIGGIRPPAVARLGRSCTNQPRLWRTVRRQPAGHFFSLAVVGWPTSGRLCAHDDPDGPRRRRGALWSVHRWRISPDGSGRPRSSHWAADTGLSVRHVDGNRIDRHAPHVVPDGYGTHRAPVDHCGAASALPTDRADAGVRPSRRIQWPTNRPSSTAASLRSTLTGELRPEHRRRFESVSIDRVMSSERPGARLTATEHPSGCAAAR